MNKLLLRLPPPWPLLGAVQIWVDDALEPRLSHGEHEFISAREALSFTLSTVPWGSAFRVLVGSLKVIDRPAVLVEERWSAIPIWLHLGDVRLSAVASRVGSSTGLPLRQLQANFSLVTAREGARMARSLLNERKLSLYRNLN